MSEPAEALRRLARELRAEGSVISPQVAPDPQIGERPALGELAAAGPRAAAAAGEYALVLESVREGYLLHYGATRVLVGADADLALLAGDYLYALGLDRLAALGDLEAVRELCDLISISAQLHAERRTGEEAAALWLAVSVAVGCGAGPSHVRAKELLRAGDPTATVSLASAASAAAEETGIGAALREAADSIDFPLELHS